MTKKGSGKGLVRLSMDTCLSFMASRRALWVLGVERLISSARTKWWNMGPGLNSKAPELELKTETPRMSLGRRSEVNWILWNERPKLRARARARVVLPTPGTSSMRRWPSEKRQRSAWRTIPALPRTILDMLDSMVWATDGILNL